MSSILIVSASEAGRELLSQSLRSAGYDVATARDVDEAVRAALTARVDVAVVDLLMQGDGTQLRLRLREIHSDTRFVWLAAPAHEALLVHAADPVLRKPADARDVRMAVAAALRGSGTAGGTKLSLGEVALDADGQRLLGKAGPVPLTPLEYKLIDYLARLAGGIASVEELLQHVWGYAPGTGSSDVVRAHLKNLRGKVRRCGGGEIIHTLPRRGYRLVVG